MEKESSIILTEINIRDSLLTGFLKGLVNIPGLTELYIVGILSKDTEMDMEYGLIIHRVNKTIKDITCLTKNMASEFTIGQTDIYTKEVSSKTKDVEKVNCFIITI